MHVVAKVVRVALSPLYGIVILFCVFMMIIDPVETLQASVYGLRLWWEQVLPAMLPLLVLCEALVQLGFFRALGGRLAPFMRIVYQMPPATGWAWVSGFALGTPMGTKVVVDLRRRNEITTDQGNRLLAICDLCSPLWIISVVCTAYWHRPEYGIVLVVLHVCGALMAGLICNALLRDLKSTSRSMKDQPSSDACVCPAPSFPATSPPLGRIVGESIRRAFETLLLLGGWIVLCAVLIHMLMNTHLFQPFISPETAYLFYGWIDLNLGTAQMPPALAPDVDTAVWIGAMLGWGGLSLHAQVREMIRGTGLRYASFALGRLVHAVLSIPLTLWCWTPLLDRLHVHEVAFASITHPMVHRIAWSPLMTGALALGTLCAVFGMAWIVSIGLHARTFTKKKIR